MCPAQIFLLIPNQYLKCKIVKTGILNFLSQRASSTFFSISVRNKFIFPVAQTKTWSHSLTPFFLSYLTINLSENFIGSAFKIFQELNHI